MRRPLLAALLIATLGLAGCTMLESTPCYSRAAQSLIDATDLKGIFTDMAAELCQSPCTQGCGPDRQACATDAARQTVLVTDFANLDTYIPGQHGLLMGELMRAALSTQCCNRIIQAEFGKYFKLSGQGLVALTRNVEEIRRDEFPYQDIVVGTYSFHGSKLVLFVRKIDSRSGIVTRMVSREIDYTCRGNAVSSDVK